ncbi:MAG: hypothetical protein NZV14_10405 [Bryobacteraceae bacterium]|nr:hypothetical protein [Bryobacteraceae bacterium]MDW8378564.1 hypothetical protein [Bryobacterales bacterium]
MRKGVLFLLLPLLAPGQPTVAPTDAAAGSVRGENVGGYNVVNHFELGYRFRSVEGNLGKYRSDVNFGNGIRLLGSEFRANSREGQGKFFDEFTLNTQGLGNDPYQSSVLRLEKNRIYRYDLHWRLNEYFNPALTIANGLHRMDTSRRFQDHDFFLFPQSRFKLIAGHTRYWQSGPALSTFQAFDSRGDEFPLLADIRRGRKEYRLGGEAALAGFTFHVLRGWDHFREDTPFNVDQLEPGANPADNTTLRRFRRTEPYQGDSPYWRLALVRNSKVFSMNARYTAVAGRRDFALDETAVGTDRLGAARNRQILVTGTGSRPVTSGNLNLVWTPLARLTLSNHSAYHNTRMNGQASLQELENSQSSFAILNFQFLGIRAISNLTDATVALTKKVNLYAGYHFSDRRIRSREGEQVGSFSDVFSSEQSNRLHAGLGGVRLRPVKPLFLQFDVELGRANQPFTPISEKNYHSFNARVQWRARTVQLSALTRTLYNVNSTNFVFFSSRSRHYAYDGVWNLNNRFSVEAGYSKLHLDTQGALAYFAASRRIEDQNSLYVSNLHTGHLAARLVLAKRFDLSLGYSIVRDTGDGRPAPSLPLTSIRNDAREAFALVQVFPLRYQSPLARLSVKIRSNLGWNFGYQYYGYREDFLQLTGQNYRAHTGFSSLLWSF